MIISELKGGLGNQMFQYALGRHLALRNGLTLRIDISAFKGGSGRENRPYVLDKFNIHAKVATTEEIRKTVPFGGLGLLLAERISTQLPKYSRRYLNYYREINSKPNDSSDAIPRWFNFEPSMLEISGDAFLSGYWQAYEYFEDIEDILRDEFQLSIKLSDQASTMAGKISSVESVGVHVRRGDYVDIGATLPKSYFTKGINNIERLFGKIDVFVFSDDIEWAEKNLEFERTVTFVNIKSQYPALEEFDLLQRCDHNIISNSTFSWWSAWLNDNSDKCVIAPQVWFEDRTVNEMDLIPDDWRVIDVPDSLGAD